MEDKIIELLITFLEQFGYHALFILMFLETALFLGVFIPGETLVVLSGLVAARGIFRIEEVILIASLGAVLGDTAGYFIGTRFGESIFTRFGKYLFIKERKLEAVKRFFKKHGGKTVFLGRFTSLLRAFAPGMAGMSKMFFPKFFLYNVTGGVTWVVVFSTLGYLVGNSLPTLKLYMSYISQISMAGLAAFAFAVFFFFVLKKRKAIIMEKISVVDRLVASRANRLVKALADMRFF